METPDTTDRREEKHELIQRLKRDMTERFCNLSFSAAAKLRDTNW
jgi:excinuclease UvrABC helicase subunit UvrB